MSIFVDHWIKAGFLSFLGDINVLFCNIVGPPVVGENYREIASALRQIGDELDGDHQLQE